MTHIVVKEGNRFLVYGENDKPTGKWARTKKRAEKIAQKMSAVQIKTKGKRRIAKRKSNEDAWTWFITNRFDSSGWGGNQLSGRELTWVDKRIKPIGFEVAEHLGSGHWGDVYNLRNLQGENTGYVIKFTMDPTEAAAARQTMDWDNSAFPYTLGVWEMPRKIWFIIREGLWALDEVDFDAKGNTIDELLDDEGAMVWLDEKEQTLIRLFRRGLQKAKDQGLEISDLHDDNIRSRRHPDGSIDLVVSDLGLSYGPEMDIPIAKNPRRNPKRNPRYG